MDPRLDISINRLVEAFDERSGPATASHGSTIPRSMLRGLSKAETSSRKEGGKGSKRKAVDRVERGRVEREGRGRKWRWTD